MPEVASVVDEFRKEFGDGVRCVYAKEGLEEIVAKGYCYDPVWDFHIKETKMDELDGIRRRLFIASALSGECIDRGFTNRPYPSDERQS